jgi:phosphatidate cytidylyltransferase
MKTRVLTGALLGLFFVPVFVIGGWLLYIVLGLMSVYAGYEMLKMVKVSMPIPNAVFVYGLIYNALMFAFLLYAVVDDGVSNVLLPVLLGLVLSGSLFMVFVEEVKFDLFANLTLSILYPVFGFVSLAMIRDQGLAFLGLLFVITVSTDVFAYFVGIRFGKHRLAPRISPKKSVEGSLGGLFFAALFALVYVLVVNRGQVIMDIDLWLVVILAILVSIMAQVGDLVASKMKRTYGIKDFSNLFPGHGGVMDRFDSSMFAAMLFVLIGLLGLIG